MASSATASSSSTTSTTTKTMPAAPAITTRLLNPSSNSIPLLASSPARIYSAYVHGPLVAAYYLRLRAAALVEDPLATMIADLIPLVLVQAVFCVVCLPVAGAWNSGTAAPATQLQQGASKKKAGQSPKGEGLAAWGNRVMQTLLALILTIVLPPIPLTVLALCLGAPLYPTSLLPHTLVLSVHVSLLGFLPLFYTHGVSALAWRDVLAAWIPFDEAGVWGGTVGCMVGGWIGAIPIALDWDREWQKWPCTVLWGVVLGWTLGRTLTSTLKLGLGKRIDLNEKNEDEDVMVPIESSSAVTKVQAAKSSDDKKKKKVT